MNHTKQQESLDFLEYEHPDRTLLKRDIKAIALKRMEDAARSISDFEDVIKQWDHLDDNRERKERYHEIDRENIDSRKNVAPLAIVIPAPIDYSYWRQLMKGDFIDIIFNCPFEIHESLADEDYSKIIYELKDEHKELLYFLYIRLPCETRATETFAESAPLSLGRSKIKYF